MKKILLLVSSTALLANNFFAQDSDTDRKFRLGLKVSGQPTWFSSKDKNAEKLSTAFGFGFGLVTEFRLSNTAYFTTGIGGDFEGGSIKYKYQPATSSNSNNYTVGYVTDNSGNLKESKDGVNIQDYVQTGDVVYNGITERKIKTTHVTIPITLKMMTKEITGFRYFGQFGGELGLRVKAKADDRFVSSITNNGTTSLPTFGAGGTNSGVNINKDGSLIPLRFGLNVGLGAEYRLSGSTSAFISVNYFRSFTNLMRNESKYLVYDGNIDSNGTMTFFRVKQGLMMNAIRINLGVMF